MRVRELLERTCAVGGSDLHLHAGLVPRIRVHGELADVEGCPVLGDHELVLVSTRADGSPVEVRQPVSIQVAPPWWWLPLGVASAVGLIAALVLLLLGRRADRKAVDPAAAT